MTLSNPNLPKKILVIQLRQLGDVLMTTPLVRQLRGLYPNSEIHFLTEKLGSEVYKYNPYVNNLLILPRKMSLLNLIKEYKKIKKERFDLVIDAFGNPKSAQLTFFSRAAERIGFYFKYRSYAYNKLITSHENYEYSAKTKLRLISHLGGNIDDNRIEFFIHDDLKKYAHDFFKKYLPKKRVIAFHVVSRRDYKIWDSNHFVDLGNQLIEKGYFLFFTYGPGEFDMANEVYNKIINKKQAIIKYPLPNIPQLRALLGKCERYIGNDGGVKHLAVSANIPTFTIFQNINWTNWTPPNTTDHQVATNCLQDKKFCDNCFDHKKCYPYLSAEKVVQKMNFLKEEGKNI